MIKVNWGNVQNILCTDKTKINIAETNRTIHTWLDPRTNQYYPGLEWGYKNIEPKIICEKFLENFGNDLYDYKFFCFNGRVEYIMFLSERQSGLKMAFYDRNWNKQPFVYHYPMNDKEIPKPDNLSEMIELAEELGSPFPHARVDFYRLDNGQIIFGEITFYSFSGFCPWNPPEWDLKLGNMLQLPEVTL